MDQLGPLTVSRLALGAMLFGDTTPPDDVPRIFDAFLDAGHNLVDTADVYNDGESERLLAPLLARRRDEVVLATKLRFVTSLAPERIAEACDASLRRLGVDVIDLYQVHAPEPTVPIEDTLEALDALVRAGKVRALGASNLPAWLLAWSVAFQRAEGLSPFVSFQPQYSLVERSIEVELLPFCRAAGLGVLPWGPLGAGFLSGRYQRDAPPPEGSRMALAGDDLEEAVHRRALEHNFRAVDAAREVADELGATIPQVAIAWVMHQPGITAPILGPRTFAHLEDLLPAADLSLSEDQIGRLGRFTAPPDTYPQRMLVEQVGIDMGTQRLRL